MARTRKLIDTTSYPTLKRAFLQGSIQPLAGLLPHLKQIAAALQYAHHQQVLHGDIRPENVLLDGNNNVLLRGFTFEAVMQNRARLNYQLAGIMPEAIAYSAPEQIRGKAEPASDQYSLAILIYELLCGAVPFTGSSIEVANQQMHALPPLLRQRVPAISAKVEGTILKALEKDSGRRFSDIQTFINTLEQEQIAQFEVAKAQRQLAPTMSLRKFAEVDDTVTNTSRRCHLYDIVLPPALRHTFPRKRYIRFHRKNLKKQYRS